MAWAYRRSRSGELSEAGAGWVCPAGASGRTSGVESSWRVVLRGSGGAVD